uniref:Uncharacterized protein n=1 Tax=Vitis vinifera TaxID=29760 RepID=F6HSK1_VITVI
MFCLTTSTRKRVFLFTWRVPILPVSNPMVEMLFTGKPQSIHS